MPDGPDLLRRRHEGAAKHGPLIASFATVDRLLHESGPAFHDQPVEVGGRMRFLDPHTADNRWVSSRPFSTSV